MRDNKKYWEAVKQTLQGTREFNIVSHPRIHEVVVCHTCPVFGGYRTWTEKWVKARKETEYGTIYAQIMGKWFPLETNEETGELFVTYGEKCFLESWRP